MGHPAIAINFIGGVWGFHVDQGLLLRLASVEAENTGDGDEEEEVEEKDD